MRSVLNLALASVIALSTLSFDALGQQ